MEYSRAKKNGSIWQLAQKAKQKAWGMYSGAEMEEEKGRIPKFHQKKFMFE